MTNTIPYEFDHELQQKRMMHVLQNALTEKQRATLLAHYFENKPICQIARERGVNRASVWRCLRRAEDRMRRYLLY